MVNLLVKKCPQKRRIWVVCISSDLKGFFENSWSIQKKYHKTTFKEKELDPKKTFANFRSVAKDLTLNLPRNKASEFFFFFHSQWSVHWSTGCKDPATQKTRLSGHYRATLLREDEVQTCSWQKDRMQRITSEFRNEKDRKLHEFDGQNHTKCQKVLKCSFIPNHIFLRNLMEF